ncbi:MAG: ABC transporter permease, partial [Acidobacteriota bacterium]|nr:ABC transporter permease [Acidobacteriota bacterium]
METLLKDIHYGYRTLLRNPGFTAVAVLSLALGIGANTAIFSFIDTVLLRDMPVRDPGRLVVFGEGKGRGIYGGPPDGSMDLFGWQQYQNFRSRNKVFEDVAATNSLPTRVYFTLTGEGASGVPEGAQANLVSGNFFDVLGVKPAAGRFFDATTDKAVGASAFVVLNYSFWASRFNRAQSVIGQPIRVGAQSFTVIGVAPRGFFGARLGESPDFWIPLSMQPRMPGAHDLLTDALAQFTCLFARLKPGVTIAQASANVNFLYQQMLPGEMEARATPSEWDTMRHARIVVGPGGRGLAA